METYLDYGDRLMVDCGTFGESPAGYFHIHPHFELTFALVPVSLTTPVCGKQLVSDYPCAVFTAPFIPHFSNPTFVAESRKYKRFCFYFGASAVSSLNLPFSLNDLLGNGICRIINITKRVDQLSHLISAFQVLINESERKYLFGTMLCILWEMVNQGLPNSIVVNHMEDYILQVIRYVAEHLDSKCDIQELSSQFYVSPDKLRKDFKRCTSVNVGEFVQRMRLNRVRELLSDCQKMPISDIMRECGYESESYFYKVFRENTGVTPLEYRRIFKR